MARRATVIKDIRESSQGPVLVLDAGNSLFGQSLAAASNGRVIVEAMNAMGYDALGIGQLELLQGLEVLKQRATEARFPLLSCNLVSAEDGKPIFAPYTIITRRGVRLGILGVSEPDLAALPALNNVAKVLEPLSAVSRYLPEVRAQSDIVIVLSHLGLEMDTTLAQAVPGIQVIVGGKTGRLLTAPQTVAETIILQAGYDGEWLGRLDVQLDDQRRPVDPQVEIITLGPDIADDPQLAALVASYAQRFPTPTPPSR